MILLASFLVQVTALVISLRTLNRWFATYRRVRDYPPARAWLSRQVSGELILTITVATMLVMTGISMIDASANCHVGYGIVRGLVCIMISAHSAYAEWSFKRMGD